MTITLEALRERVEPWCAPISAASPGGTDPSGDPRFESVCSEMVQLASPAASPPPWRRIVQMSRELLTERVKDLRIACYLAYAQGVVEGLDGLGAGLMIVAELLDRYWVELFPPVARTRARANMLAWLVDRAGRHLADVRLRAGDRAAVEALAIATRHLAGVARNRLGDQTPAFGPLTNVVDRLTASLSDLVDPAASTPETSAPSASTPAGAQGQREQRQTVNGGSSERSSALWRFAHKALSPEFHRDPRRFVATLDELSAPAYLENMWRWARKDARPGAPELPPLSYSIFRPDNFVLLPMRFRDVDDTGAPWAILFVIKVRDPAQPPVYARMFLLEHSEYATERAGQPLAILCESLADGVHRNWGSQMAPDDQDGFRDAVYAILRQAAQPDA